MVKTIQAHEAAVLAVGQVTLPENEETILLSVAADGTIAGWDAATGAERLPPVKLGASLVAAVVASPDQVLAATDDGRLLSWRPGAADGRQVGHHDGLRQLQPEAGGVGLLLLDAASGVAEWNERGGAVRRLADDRRVLLASAAAPPRQGITGAAQPEPAGVVVADPDALPPLENDQSEQYLVAADGRRIIGVDATGTVQMWDLHSGRLLGVLTPAGGRPPADDLPRPSLVPRFEPPVLATLPRAQEEASLGLTDEFDAGQLAPRGPVTRNPLAGLEEEE